MGFSSRGSNFQMKPAEAENPRHSVSVSVTVTIRCTTTGLSLGCLPVTDSDLPLARFSDPGQILSQRWWPVLFSA